MCFGENWWRHCNQFDSYDFSSTAYLELDSRSRLCWTTDVAGLMLGVAQRDVLRSHWSRSFSSSSSVGPPPSWGTHTRINDSAIGRPRDTHLPTRTYPRLRFCWPRPWRWSGPTSGCCRWCGPWTSSASAASPSCWSPRTLAPWTRIWWRSQRPGSRRFCQRRRTVWTTGTNAVFYNSYICKVILAYSTHVKDRKRSSKANWSFVSSSLEQKLL